MTAPAWVAIDFGTSNSAVALSAPGGGVRLLALEGGQTTMPTALFYCADTPAQQLEPERLYGRAAVQAYVDGHEGRLMRSMKSILGSTLLDQRTDIGAGRAVAYRDVVTSYLRHLQQGAEREAGQPLKQLVLGRPVFFVDEDPQRDAQAQAALEAAARQLGFEAVHFQFEPIAAALDFEQRCSREQCVLVADIGGGTSDFSLVRVGPQRRGRLQRRDDILSSHGVHLAGTDFDRHVSLAAVMPLLGYRSLRPARPGEAPREIPSGIYFDLATWHLINTVYQPARLAEVRGMKSWFADSAHHRRLLTTLNERLGHALAAAAEQAKIDVALQGQAHIELGLLERGLASVLSAAQAAQALEDDLARIVAAAHETVHLAGLVPAQVDALYFTGGSTGLNALVERIAAGFPQAELVRGERFASVAQGLGAHARSLFAPVDRARS